MKQTSLKKLMTLLLAAMIFLIPAAAYADSGPKASVQIDLSGLQPGETCYATLLSSVESTGPWSAWDGNEAEACYQENPGHEWAPFDKAVWQAFEAYEDEDGYYFLQHGQRVDTDNCFQWNYYPPANFKILVYFPDHGRFFVSGPCERYAFSSYFAVEVPDPATGGETLLQPARSYDYGRELLGLLLRIVLTLAAELLVALLFGYWGKRDLKFIVLVNLFTQIALNVLLNVCSYRSGPLAALLLYLALELAVFLIEAALYCRFLHRKDGSRTGKPRAVLYALAANLSSFVVGRLVMLWFSAIV